MSQPPSSNDDGVELRISLPGGLKVVVSAPSSSASLAAELLGHISTFQGSSSAAPSERSFELVSSLGDPDLVAPARVRGSETRDSILASFCPCPSRLLSHSGRLSGASISGEARVRRAWLAGQWAGAVRSSRIGSPNRTPAIELRPRFYAVLRADNLEKPTIFRSAASYWRCIGSLENSSSISQAFPSEIEAKIYLEAAGEVDVDFAP